MTRIRTVTRTRLDSESFNPNLKELEVNSVDSERVELELDNDNEVTESESAAGAGPAPAGAGPVTYPVVL